MNRLANLRFVVDINIVIYLANVINVELVDALIDTQFGVDLFQF